MVIAALASCGAAAAAEEVEAPEEPRNAHFRFRPIAWAPTFEGDLRNDSGLLPGTTLDLDDDLDLSDLDVEPAGEVGLRLGGLDLWLSGFRIENSGQEVVDATIVFGDLVIPVSDTVLSDIELESVRLQLGHTIIGKDDDDVRLSLTLTAHLYHLDARLESLTTGLSESVDETVVFPTVGVRLEVPVGDFLLSVDASTLFVDVDVIEAGFVDVTGLVSWAPIHNLAVIGGYRYIGLDASGGGVTLDSELHGPFVGAEIRF
jgi:hypothetical protein